MLLLVIFSLVTGCKTVSNSAALKSPTNFTSVNTVSSLHFPTLILRINTDGFLRTHKASLSYLADSLLAINIYSNINRPLAYVVFDNKGLMFYEKHSGLGNFYSYQYLSKSVTYPISFSLVRDLLFGFSNKITPTLGQNFETEFLEFNEQNNFTYSFFLSKNDEGNPLLFDIQSSKPIIKLSFGTISPQNLLIPESLMLAIVFNFEIFEFEVEYNFKKLLVNKEVSVIFDNSFPLKTVE